jgi:Tol biopolymer transport system component
MSLADKPAGGPAATPVALTTGQGFLPRLGPGYLVYVSSYATSDIIWKLVNGSATTLWTAADTRIVGGPEIAPDGRRIAFSVKQNGKTRLYTINADGTEARAITDALELEGAPAWAPDGQWLLSAVDVKGTPNLFRIPLQGAPTPFVRDYATDPVWSPDGRFVIYSGADIGTTFSVKAVTSTGASYAIPSLLLRRGERRLRFLANSRTLLVLRGDLRHHSLWRADLQTGEERELTNLPPDFNVQDFDISPDGSELVLERSQQHSDVVLIDLAHRH